MSFAPNLEFTPTIVACDPATSKVVPVDEGGRLKRVLYILDLSPAGRFPSLAEQALVLAREFRDRGSLFLPVYLPPVDTEFASMHREHGIAIEELDLRSMRFSALWQLLRLIRDNRIEVVHWNFYNPIVNGYLWALMILAPRVEHFYTDHISRTSRVPAQAGGRVKSALKRQLSRIYSQTLCISQYVRSELECQRWSNLKLAYNFINTDRFCPDAKQRKMLRRSLNADAKFVAVTVAYLINDKGVAVAIRALPELPLDVVLWIVGNGPERGDLELLARDLGVGERVRFLGSHRNVVPFMQAADCFLCPSLWKEGAGNANFEAMACGLPDIASRIGGIPEFVEDGRNGFLFSPGDHRELAQAMRKLYADPELRNRLAGQARSIVVQRYSTAALLPEHLAIYR
jgi:glycosyltransferase involved in cell wall biosynthesis